jgi:hypothetical protein
MTSLQQKLLCASVDLDIEAYSYLKDYKKIYVRNILVEDKQRHIRHIKIDFHSSALIGAHNQVYYEIITKGVTWIISKLWINHKLATWNNFTPK